MKKVTGLVTIILIGLIISSCDKKNALLVNRRTVTPEIIEEIKEKEKAAQVEKEKKAKEEEETKIEETQKAKEERSTVTPLNSKQISEQTKEKESEPGPNKSPEPVSDQEQVSKPTEDKDSKSISEPTKEEEPKQISPSLAPQQAATGSVVAVYDSDSSSVSVVQSEASSAPDPKLEKSKGLIEENRKKSDSKRIRSEYLSRYKGLIEENRKKSDLKRIRSEYLSRYPVMAKDNPRLFQLIVNHHYDQWQKALEELVKKQEERHKILWKKVDLEVPSPESPSLVP